MKRREIKGRNPIFNPKSQACYISSGEESQDEQLATVREGDKNATPDDCVIVLDDDEPGVIVLDSDESSATQSQDIFQDSLHETMNLLFNSNFSDLVTDFMGKFYPGESERKNEVYHRLFEIYMKNPTSRRCPVLNFHSLHIQQGPIFAWEASQLKEFNIKPCRVDLSKANVLFSLEKRIYRNFRNVYPLSKESMKFLAPKTLAFLVSEYLCHIQWNICAIFRQPKQLSGIVARDREVEFVVNRLFALLDAEVEKMNNNPEPAQEARTLEESPAQVQRRVRPPPQKLKILKADLKNPNRQCSKEEITNMLMEGRLEMHIQMHTRLGMRFATIHGDDIQRFLNISPPIWKKLTNILGAIAEERTAGTLTANSKLLTAFADLWSRKLKVLRDAQLRGQKPSYQRYYTIHDSDEESENLIEIEK